MNPDPAARVWVLQQWFPRILSAKISHSNIHNMAPTSKQKKTASKKKTSTAKVSKAKLGLATRFMSPCISEERDEDSSSYRGDVIDVDGDIILEAVDKTDDEEELGNLLIGSK